MWIFNDPTEDRWEERAALGSLFVTDDDSEGSLSFFFCWLFFDAEFRTMLFCKSRIRKT